MASRPVLLLLLRVCMASAWNPDAGLVASLTKTDASHVLSSSDQSLAGKANDGNDNTHWTSGGCMPGGFYLDNPLTNIFYKKCQQGHCFASTTDKTDIGHVSDGDVSTGYRLNAARYNSSVTEARLTINLEVHQSLRDLTIRGSYNGVTQLIIMDRMNWTVVATITASDSYHTLDFNVTLTPATTVMLRSAADFVVYELGAVGDTGCVERVYVDMGSMHSVSMVRTRHWAGGHGLSTCILASGNGFSWNILANLDPKALQPVVTYLPNPMTFRYLAVQHRQDETSYAKVYVWEMDAYTYGGMYGTAPSPKANPTSLREMFGVNAIWGWGWGSSSTTLPPGQGAQIYAPLASYGRCYHNLNWDVRDPDDKPDYVGMAQGKGTAAQLWLNWDREYSQWVAANLSVHVSIQFTAKMFPVSTWNDPYSAAFQFGMAFAQHFGPTHGNGLVRSVEVGNEPWDYPAKFYATILEGMAEGFKAGDGSLLVLPAAFQAHDPTSTGSYIGTHVPEEAARTIDAINTHHYSWRRHADGSRRATYPEDPAGSFAELHSMIRWRDSNTPTKPLWVTEWGWDSDGGGQDCSKFPECTTERAASDYAARALLMHARLGVARSTWFFYGNLDECDDHVFCRSGLTSSKSGHFAKKGPYHTLRHLIDLLGHTHFLYTIQEDDQAYVYVFGSVSPDQTATHLVAWRPVDSSTAEGTRDISITFTCTHSPARAWRLPMDEQLVDMPLPTWQAHSWIMSVIATPTVVQLMPSDQIIG